MKDEWGTYLDDIVTTDKEKVSASVKEGSIEQILYSVCESLQMSAAVLGSCWSADITHA